MEGNCGHRSDPHSDFIMEFVYGARKYKVLLGAIKARIFDDIRHVGNGDWATDAQLAEFRQYNLDNTRRFLNTLASLKLLDRGSTVGKFGEERQFRNTIAVDRYLRRTSHPSMVAVFDAEETLMPLFDKNLYYVLKFGSVDQFPRLLWKGGYPQDDAFLKLPDFAVSARLEYANEPSHYHSSLQPFIGNQERAEVGNLPLGANTVLCNREPKSLLQIGRELFMDHWNSQQDQCMQSLIEAFNLRDYKTIVDLGGGSGHLAWHILQQHPNIYITVFDTPRVIESILPPFVMNMNLKFIKGDFFKDLLPRADCYILSHVLREYEDEKAELLLGLVYQALNQGGVVLILEKVLSEDKRAPTSALMDDLLAATISCGRERTESEYRYLLEKNGLAHTHVKRVVGLNTFDVMIARRPCEPVIISGLTKDLSKV